MIGQLGICSFASGSGLKQVTAACATGYEGNAMVEPCDNHYGHWSRQFTRYSGCLLNPVLLYNFVWF